MKGVLVDTSVWVDHFRSGNAALVELLELDMVLVHPLIIGEIACGTLPKRAQTISDIGLLCQTQQAGVLEVIDFISHQRLYGIGCGFVDLTLLVSTLLTPGVELWTLDKRLHALSKRFKIAHRPVVH